MKVSTTLYSPGFGVGFGLVLCGLAIGIAPAAIAKPHSPGGLAQVPGNTPTATNTTNFSGTVERYLLNREGLADGLLLNNGLQVTFPPHLSASLVATIKPGDRVTLTGFPGISSSFGQEVQGYSITNTASGKTVIDQPSATPPVPPTPVAAYSNLSASGTARSWLVGRQGELRGIVLSDGTQIKFPPHIGYRLSNLAQSGAKVEAQGYGTNSGYGKTLEATSLTIAGQPVPIDAPTPGLLPGVPPAPVAPAPVQACACTCRSSGAASTSTSKLNAACHLSRDQ